MFQPCVGVYCARSMSNLFLIIIGERKKDGLYPRQVRDPSREYQTRQRPSPQGPHQGPWSQETHPRLPTQGRWQTTQSLMRVLKHTVFKWTMSNSSSYRELYLLTVFRSEALTKLFFVLSFPSDCLIQNPRDSIYLLLSLLLNYLNQTLKALI